MRYYWFSRTCGLSSSVDQISLPPAVLATTGADSLCGEPPLRICWPVSKQSVYSFFVFQSLLSTALYNNNTQNDDADGTLFLLLKRGVPPPPFLWLYACVGPAPALNSGLLSCSLSEPSRCSPLESIFFSPFSFPPPTMTRRCLSSETGKRTVRHFVQ